MRTYGFKLFAITSMLALLLGGQVCMLVQCSPSRAPGEAHACCTKAATKPVPNTPATPESARPCCIRVTIANAPSLEPPAAVVGHAPAALLAVLQLDAAPRAALAPSPPGDDESPPPPPLLTAAGSRAPPASA